MSAQFAWRSRVGRRVAVATVLSLVAVLATPTVSFAAYWHELAIAVENNQGPGYTGLKLHRDALSGVKVPACRPVYDSMWVYTDRPTADWLEMPTTYDCDGQGRSRIRTLLGYGINGNWFQLVSVINGSLPGDHTFNIRQDYGQSNTWEWRIDGVAIWNNFAFAGGITAEQLDVGLETYDDANIVPAHTIHDLKKRRYGGSFLDWAGRDGFDYPAWPMCGHWVSDASILVAEHAVCP